MTDLRQTIEDERLTRLLDYWESRRAGRIMPARTDIDPVDIAWLLGHVLLIDVQRDPQRFRFRLVGTKTPRRHNVDFTGMWVDEIPFPEAARTLVASYRDLVALARPARVVRNEVLDGHRIRWETIVLPLAADGETVDMLLIAVIERPG